MTKNKLTKSMNRKQRKKLKVTSNLENKLASFFRSLIKLKVDENTKISDIQEQLKSINIKKLTKAIDRTGFSLFKHNRKGFDMMMKDMLGTKEYQRLLNKGFHSMMQEKYIMKPLLDKFKENVLLIKDLPKDVAKKLEEGYKLGVSFRGSTIERFIKERMGNRAKLIIRTESAKLNAALTEIRAKDLSIICYIWSTSEDIRVRASHKAMDNVLVFWSDPPTLDGIKGNCGESYNCRCTALPVFNLNDIHFPVKVCENFVAKTGKNNKLQIISGQIRTYTKAAFINTYGYKFI